ncbi:MAG TPA: hypothetical protein VGK73_32985, partial [Polyangiaceae bacterium]
MQQRPETASDPSVPNPQPENGHGAGSPSLNGSGPDFARSLLDALVRFRDGDFSSRMQSDLVGVEGKIADVFNDILSVSARRTAETARVCRVVGKEGKLKERMRVPGAQGGWADEVSDLNTLIDDLVWPT